MTGPILVTGATGVIGREAIKQLVKAKANVRAGIYNPSKTNNIDSTGFEQVNFNLENTETIDSALNGVEKVLLILPVRENMLEMMKNFVNVAKNKNIKHIVLISRMGADTPGNSTILKMYGQCEEILLSSSIPAAIIRSNWLMQDFIKYASTIKNPGAYHAPISLKASISFVDVRDVVEVAVSSLMNSKGGLCILTGPQTFTHRQVEDNFAFILGKRVIFHTIKDEEFKTTMLGYGVSEWAVNAKLELYKEAEQGTFAEILPDNSQLLGRKPETFKTFAKAYVKYFK
jgi:uncharacterized protein YbjT (DUF2867 family)